MADRGGSLRRSWAKARLLAHSVHDLGLPTIGHIVANSARREAERRAHSTKGPAPAASIPGRRLAMETHRAGVQIEFERASLDVSFLAEDVVRVSWGPAAPPLPYAVPEVPPWVAPDIDVAEGPGGSTVVRSDGLEVVIDPLGSLRYCVGGVCRRQEGPPSRLGAAWQQSFRALPGERFFGLGEQAWRVDLRGGRFQLWNRDPGGAWGVGRSPLYLNIPVLLATHDSGGLLSFYDNPTKAVVTVAPHEEPEGEVSVSFAGGMLRQYVAAGDPAHLLHRFSALTGRPALPARWALGYHQSRWGYKRQDQVRAVIDGFREMNIPLSVVHLDIDYMRGYRVFSVDTKRFPDLRGLCEGAATGGVRIVCIVDPAVKVDSSYPLYRYGEQHELFCRDPVGKIEIGVVWPGRAAFPDFTDAATRSWWAAQYRGLTDAGVAGIWHDMNEPTSIALTGDPTLPATTRHHLEGRGGDHGDAHNLYGLLMNRAGADGLRRAKPHHRPFIVSRSGWAGMQRDAWNWTGDVETSWAAMRQQVATVIGLGLSGVPYSGSDIGGFSGVPDDELYLRWLQMSVFFPFCRTHSVVGAPAREPWRFKEPTRGAIAAWIRFRYRLLPYLYSLAHEASVTGAPLVRPLWWPMSKDADRVVVGAADTSSVGDLGDVDDAFLLGPGLLVAPVTESGARQRTVRLPPGRWQPMWRSHPESESFEAAAHANGVVVTAGVDGIPVMVRAGSVLALDDGWAGPGGPCALHGDEDLPYGAPSAVSLDHRPDRLAFHCWAFDAAASGTAYDDCGDGDGPWRRDALEVSGVHDGGTAAVRWKRQGDYPAPSEVRFVLHGFEVAEAEADGRPAAVSGCSVQCPAFDELVLRGLKRTGA